MLEMLKIMYLSVIRMFFVMFRRSYVFMRVERVLWMLVSIFLFNFWFFFGRSFLIVCVICFEYVSL